jgi:hypothetical protein
VRAWDGRGVIPAWLIGHVVPTPRLDDDDRLGARTKPLHIEALVAEFPVEALVNTILPGHPGRDVVGVDADVSLALWGVNILGMEGP